MDLEKNLISLNWNKNDAIVYIALVKLGASTPQSLSEETSIDRTRIYDSLKRLIQKGAVLKEDREWGGKYQAVAVDDVFSQEIDTIKKQLDVATNLKQELKEIEKNKEDEQRLVWAIQGKKNVRDTIEAFLESARERVYWLMSPDLFGPPIQKWAFESIIKQKTEKEIPDIKVSLAVIDENKAYVKKMIDASIMVYARNESLLPLALLIVDSNKFIQLSISNFEPAPGYDFGIYGNNVTKAQMMGMEYLYLHLLKDHKLLDANSI
ncbi:MAG TPA: helix-turn-helix domain-containing protein [Candidatus Lokiarchaeia archaeon]|nr:helix-turn-helix domain-containing protein [Candidatus Lokiarchaeia archaeon]